METRKAIIKTQYNGDIRRITVEDTITFRDLKKLLRKLYKIPYFRITYMDEESETISLNTDFDLAHAIKQAIACSRLVRLTVEATEAPPQLTDSTITNGLDATITVGQLFSSREFVERLQNLVVQTVTSKPVMDTITNKVIEALNNQSTTQRPQAEEPQLEVPQMLQEASVVVKDAVLNVSEETCAELMQSLSQPVSLVPLSVAEDNTEEIDETPAEPEPEPEPESESESEPEPKLEPEAKPEAEEVTFEEKEETSDEMPEFFVINNNSDDDRRIRKQGSTLQSLISLVRGVVKPKGQARDEDEEEIQIPDLESLLQQLNDMGFTDRDANIKVLKFHKRYNEGIDEVIEDLLLQRYEQQNKEVVQPLFNEEQP